MKQRLASRLAALAVALAICSPLQATLPLEVDGRQLPSLAPMLESTTPAVVNIATRGRETVSRSPLMDDPFFRHFFDFPRQPQERRTQSLGSGVIVDADEGYIITNHHVIRTADQITVTLADGRELRAERIGSDPDTDVAVIRIDASGLQAIRLADSDELRVGDFVVAIGNPFGLGQTVTSGIVSALGRSGLALEGYQDYIQTDASINPGNSGGALVNLRGELVGINTAILSPAGGNIGIGFAIPVNMAKAIMEQLVAHGAVSRGRLGVSVQDLTPELAEAFGLDDHVGVVITQVVPGSAADDAGLQSGDIISRVDDRPIRQATELRNIVGLMRVGDDIRIEIVRNGDRRVIDAVIGSLDIDLHALEGDHISPRLAGVVFAMAEVTTREGTDFRVQVQEVEPGSLAERAGLREGDVLLSVNRHPVPDLQELRRVASGDGELLMHVQRGEGALFVVIR